MSNAGGGPIKPSDVAKRKTASVGVDDAQRKTASVMDVTPHAGDDVASKSSSSAFVAWVKANSSITLPQEYAARLTNLISRFVFKTAKGGSKRVEDADDKVFQGIERNAAFMNELKQIIPQELERKEFVEALKKKGAAQRIIGAIRGRFGAKPGEVAEEEVGMVISAPIIRDPVQEAREEAKANLRKELEAKQRDKKPARSRDSLARAHGVEEIPLPPPRQQSTTQPGSKVPPPLPKSRPPKTASAPPPLPSEEERAKQRAASAAAKPVTHGYDGVQQQELKKEPTGERKTVKQRAQEIEQNTNPPRKPSGSV